jgi:hypothetical protein
MLQSSTKYFWKKMVPQLIRAESGLELPIQSNPHQYLKTGDKEKKSRLNN